MIPPRPGPSAHLRRPISFAPMPQQNKTAAHTAELTFLGTGTSEGVPRVSCLTRRPPTCRVCVSALQPGSKNRRRNTSLLLRYAHPDRRTRNLVIDTGKFFWQSAIDWFPMLRVTTIDAVLLTHAHTDAVGGLDDLRDWTNHLQSTIPIYLRQQDLEVVGKLFFYLVNTDQATGGGGVARLDFRTITNTPFTVEGVRFTPLPVWHGRPYSAHGFRFGSVAYVSDASEIPAETERLMTGARLLILDALRPERPHRSHMILEQSLEVVRRLRPERTLLTDMTHDYDHDAANRDLAALRQSEGLDVQLAYDGLRIPVTL